MTQSKSFDTLQLSEKTLQAVRDMGFSEPTSVQEQTIPPMMAWRDVIARAPTGTGKTCAFGIPIIEHLEPGQHAFQMATQFALLEMGPMIDRLTAAASPFTVGGVLVVAAVVAALVPGTEPSPRSRHPVTTHPGRAPVLSRRGHTRPPADCPCRHRAGPARRRRDPRAVRAGHRGDVRRGATRFGRLGGPARRPA